MSQVDSRILYFAHPFNTYNTPIESLVITRVEALLAGIRIENPNQPRHQVGYTEWKKRSEDARTQQGMGYFFEEVLPGCDGCVAMPFLDGKIGAGVAGEAAFFVEKGLPMAAFVLKNRLTLSSNFVNIQSVS